MDKAQINWLRQEAIQDGSIPNKLGFRADGPLLDQNFWSVADSNFESRNFYFETTRR